MTDRLTSYLASDNKIKDCGMVDPKTTFIMISNAGLKENHPHDMTITQEPPHYQVL